jgi:hypothetical protein
MLALPHRIVYRGDWNVATQSYKSHAMFDPLFHFVLVPLDLLLIAGSVRWLYKHFDGVHAGLLLASIILLLLTFKARLYALRLQDRIIRVEEQVRLRRLMPEDTALVETLSIDQFVGLRFAPDAEAPALARRAIQEKLDRKAIKAAIAVWRPDEDRV